MIVTTLKEFLKLENKSTTWVVDIETQGTNYYNRQESKIIGIGICFQPSDVCVYIPAYEYKVNSLVVYPVERDLLAYITASLSERNLIMHNSFFDYGWLKNRVNDKIKVYWDTRVAWHLLEPESIHRYGLEDANKMLNLPQHKAKMKELLATNGLTKATMYKLSVDQLASYNEEDLLVTARLYQYQKPLLEHMECVDTMKEFILNYQDILINQYVRGFSVDKDSLKRYQSRLLKYVSLLEDKIKVVAGAEIKKVELESINKKISTLKTEASKNNYLTNADKQEAFKFNFNSRQQLTKLLFNLGINITEKTKKNTTRTDEDTLLKYEGRHEAIRLFNKRNKAFDKIKFVTQYIECTDSDNIYHGEPDICGTASGRLVYFKPNLLAVPRRYKRLMHTFKARNGYKLVQQDFCLKGDTELLVRDKGWVKVTSISEEDFVWQVNKDTLEGSWCKPSRVISRDYVGDMYRVGNERGYFDVTKNHTMLYVGQYHKSRKDKEKLRWVCKSQDDIPTSGCNLLHGSTTSDVKVSNFTDKEIWISCMLQADGSKAAYGKFQIEVSKPRKREKIKELLGCSGTVAPKVRPKQSMVNERWRGIDFSSKLFNKETKTINAELIGDNQLDTFVEALSFWDSTVRNERRFAYFSSNKQQILNIQERLVKSNYEARLKEVQQSNPKHKTSYTLSIKKKSRVRLRKSIDKVCYSYVGKVGCVTVDAGFIIIRSNGQTFVTGNCQIEPRLEAHYTNDVDLKDIVETGKDIYLELIKHVFPDKAYLYDPKDLEGSKKRLKNERNMLKTIRLGLGYGMGFGKLARSLNISIPEARRIYNAYWTARHLVKKFENTLIVKYMDYVKTGKPIKTMFGRPIILAEQKDIVNRFIQSSAHDCLMYMNILLADMIKACNVRAYPVICDWHDEWVYEVKESDIQKYKDTLQATLKILNENLKLKIDLATSCKVVAKLSELDK